MSADQIEYQRRSAEQFDFSAAPLFRKSATLKKSSVERATAAREVVTTIAGAEETKNIAKPGDAIVTGPGGERYVIAGEKFADLYDDDPADPTRFVSKNRVRAIELVQNTEMVAPWGETQRAKSGGYVVQSAASPGDVYLVEGAAFQETYAPVGAHEAGPPPGR